MLQRGERGEGRGGGEGRKGWEGRRRGEKGMGGEEERGERGGRGGGEGRKEGDGKGEGERRGEMHEDIKFCRSFSPPPCLCLLTTPSAPHHWTAVVGENSSLQ